MTKTLQRRGSITDPCSTPFDNERHSLQTSLTLTRSPWLGCMHPVIHRMQAAYSGVNGGASIRKLYLNPLGWRPHVHFCQEHIFNLQQVLVRHGYSHGSCEIQTSNATGFSWNTHTFGHNIPLSNILDVQDRTLTGLWLPRSKLSDFLNRGLTSASFSCFGLTFNWQVYDICNRLT